jgi:hypothetical protein
LECQLLQSRLTIRRNLIRQRVKAANLLCSQLELFGGRISGSKRGGQLREKVEVEIKKLFGTAPNPLASELRHLLEQSEQLADDMLAATAANFEEELAGALISNGLNGASKDVEKAGRPAAPPLAADLSSGSLIARGGAPAALPRRSKAAAE